MYQILQLKDIVSLARIERLTEKLPAVKLRLQALPGSGAARTKIGGGGANIHIYVRSA